MKRLLHLFPAVYIAIYFFCKAGWGLRAGFTQDDLMNMYRSMETGYAVLLRDCLVFWRPSTVYRPLGALVYKLSFDSFGLDLTALSVLRYAILCANLVLVYALARRLTGSGEKGALAALLLAYHLQFSHLYYDSGTLYDTFCFFFYFAALVYYTRIRQSGRQPTPPEILVCCLLLASGLDAKEMAVTLPVLLAVYELFYHPPRSADPKALAAWLGRGWATPIVAAGITLAYCLGRVMGKDGIAGVTAYGPVLSQAEYLKQAGHYLAELLYRPDTALAPQMTVSFFLFLLAAALILRSRSLATSALLFTVGILPVAFIPWRSLSAVYIPLAGLAIFAGEFLVTLRDLLTRRLAGKILLFGLVASALQIAHPDSHSHYDSWRQEEYEPIQAVIEQMRRLHPALKSTDRVLIVEDAFGEYQWASLFIARLVYRSPSLVVDRLASMQPKPSPEEIAKYDVRLAFEDGRLRDVPAAEVPPAQ
jgi:hypothetical protein